MVSRGAARSDFIQRYDVIVLLIDWLIVRIPRKRLQRRHTGRHKKKIQKTRVSLLVHVPLLPLPPRGSCFFCRVWRSWIGHTRNTRKTTKKRRRRGRNYLREADKGMLDRWRGVWKKKRVGGLNGRSFFYEPLVEKIKRKKVGPSTVDYERYICRPLCHSVGQGTQPDRFEGIREGRGHLFPHFAHCLFWVISFGGWKKKKRINNMEREPTPCAITDTSLYPSLLCICFYSPSYFIIVESWPEDMQPTKYSLSSHSSECCYMLFLYISLSLTVIWMGTEEKRGREMNKGIGLNFCFRPLHPVLISLCGTHAMITSSVSKKGVSIWCMRLSYMGQEAK